MCIFSFSLKTLGLFLLFTITGSIVVAAFSIIVGSLSFWLVRSEMFSSSMVNILLSFATYPDGIFKGAVKFLLYLIIPVGIANYLPVSIMTEFNLVKVVAVVGYTIFIVIAAFGIFYTGLKRYSSSSLMVAKM